MSLVIKDVIPTPSPKVPTSATAGVMKKQISDDVKGLLF
jgi:hypothetical protein